MITRTPSPSPSLRLFARGICGLPTGASPWQQLSIILQRDSSASVSAFAAQSTATEQPPIWLNVTIMCMQICVCVCACVCMRSSILCYIRRKKRYCFTWSKCHTSTSLWIFLIFFTVFCIELKLIWQTNFKKCAPCFGAIFSLTHANSR